MDSYTLQILPDKAADATLDTALFTANGVLWKSGFEVERQSLEIRNNILSDVQNRETIRWFLENHATDDPFNVTRADEARRLLKTIEVELANDIAAIASLKLTKDGDLRIEFYIPADGNVPLAAFPWEILQNKMGWAFAGVFFKRYSVERVVTAQLEQPLSLNSVLESLDGDGAKILNILMLTARPGGSQDIASSHVSWPLARIVSKYPGVRKHAHLRLVRPGTWRALISELEAKGKGFYQVVHLDMHGQVEQDKYTLSFVKPHPKKGSKAHKIQAEEVARLLAAHGVRIAVVNACESSKVLESGGMFANMANIFIRDGIQAVVAMSFNAMDSTVEYFIGFLYLYLLAYRVSFGNAVTKARDKLQEFTHREATLGQNIAVMDFFVPTLYRNSGFDCNEFYASAEKEDLESKSLMELLQAGTGFIDFLAPLELIGRATEISEIESLLEACPILLLHGPGGIGKSAVLRHLGWWWKASGLVDHVIHIDLASRVKELDASDFAKDEHRYKNLMEAILKNTQPRDESSESLIMSFFDEKSCLLIIDSLETLDMSDPERNKHIQDFLERLVEKNEGAFGQGNSFIILCGRRNNAFGWNSVDDIGGYALGGLSLLHGLRYGLRVLSDIFKERPVLADDHETKAYLEYIIEILSGNPLAIEITFPALGYPDTTPRSVFEQLLTGSILPEDNSLGKTILQAWVKTGKGTFSRFCADAMDVFKLARDEGTKKMQHFPLLLSIWNCVFPRVLDPQFAFFMARVTPGKGDAIRAQLERQMISESALEDIEVFNPQEIGNFLGHLEEKGLIFPVEGKILLVEKYRPEYYRIHPVLTLWLREFLKDFLTAFGGLVDDVPMTIVDYRLVWDFIHAKAAIARFPRHDHDNQKIRATEENGRWNLVAAVIHAQRHYVGKPVIANQFSAVSRLIIPVSSLMRRFPELIFVLRPYLEEELRRHLQSDLLEEDEAVLYSATKLAFSMKFGVPIETWNLVTATMNAVDSYRAKGKTYSGHLEVSYMETRTAEAVSRMDVDPERARRLFERNLRYEPCSNDDAMGSIRRDVLTNLHYWALLKAIEEKGENTDNLSPKKENLGKGRELSSTKGNQWNNELVENFWAGSVQDSYPFQFADPAATKSFSSFARTIFKGNKRDVVADLAPDTKKLVAYSMDTMKEFEKMPEYVTLMASFQLLDGESEMAKKEFRRGIERQLQTSNDSPSNVFLHMELYKLAVKENQWQTAISHLQLIVKLSPGGAIYSTWIKLAQCYEKAGRPEDARNAALGAYHSARTHPSTPEAFRPEAIFTCNDELMELSGIKDWSYVHPKRPRYEGCNPVGDDRLNYVMLLEENLRILNNPPCRDRYTQDGAMFRALVVAVHDYLGLFVIGDERQFTLPDEISGRLLGVLLSINELMREFAEEPKLKGAGLAAFREAERCTFSPERPDLEILVDSTWAKTTLERRFSA